MFVALSSTVLAMLVACGGGGGGGTSPLPSNEAPVARVGPDQSVVTGTTVTLDGTASSDADGDSLTFSWAFSSIPVGSAATLSGANTSTPTFTPDVAGVYVVRLVVNDGTVDSAPALVTVTVSSTDGGVPGNAVPVADAGPAQSVFVGALVTLDGSASSDADGDPLTYSWAFTSKPVGSAATLSGSATVAPSFTPDLPGAYVVRLIVSDGQAASLPATVTITATALAPPAPSSHFFLFGGPSGDTYLGCLTCNSFDAESVCNQFGTYGNPFGALSIWNQFGTYGNEFSTSSPWNQFSTSGPVVIGSDGLFYGVFTTNVFQGNRTTIPAFVDVLNFYSVTKDLSATRTFACGS